MAKNQVTTTTHIWKILSAYTSLKFLYGFLLQSMFHWLYLLTLENTWNFVTMRSEFYQNYIYIYQLQLKKLHSCVRMFFTACLTPAIFQQ